MCEALLEERFNNSMQVMCSCEFYFNDWSRKVIFQLNLLSEKAFLEKAVVELVYNSTRSTANVGKGESIATCFWYSYYIY